MRAYPLAFILTVFNPLLAQTAIYWDFTPTSIIDCQSQTCTLTGTPVVSFTFTGPNSSGSAIFTGGTDTPILTGDPFSFALASGSFSSGKVRISNLVPLGLGSAAQLNTPIFNPPWAIVDYALSWDEVGGVLDSVSIKFDTQQDSVSGLGLHTGRLASDFELGGCGACDVAGVWGVSVPEPGGLALYIGPVLGLGLFWRWRARVKALA